MTRVGISKRAVLLAGTLAVAFGGLPALVPALAQEVVQAVPPRETAQLSAALRRLAQRPTDLDALLSAGNASLVLHDGVAAGGFFARAAKVAPNDPRVLLGQARVALEQRRPVDALASFAKAESAGVRPLEMAADRALAYDLVGDGASAQALYRSVLTAGDSAEVRRRYALSLAIAGNRTEFERTLYPLLRSEDRSAFRTRAFGLAILGMPDDAVEIADAMMPTDLALRMAPYLRYMPRLTKSQQAAAANLGAFPAAAEIGRDSPDIAGYAGAGARIAASANTSLTPAGAPLGPRAQPAGTGSAASTSAVRRRPAAAVPARAITPAPTPAPTLARVAVPTPIVTQPPTQAIAVAPAPTPTPQPAPARQSLSDAFADMGAAPLARTQPSVGAVDVAKLAAARAAEQAAAKKIADAAAAKAKREADAKASKTKREADAAAAKAKAEKAAKEAEPARYWAQVGVGRNTAAFGFDWKKLVKQAGGTLDGKGPWAVKYGASNRMLAGPFPTAAAAQAAVKRLKDKDIDALPYNSTLGEKVTKVG